MSTIQLGKEKFTFSPDMDLDEFTSANEEYYSRMYEEAYQDEQHRLHKLRDGDTDDMREWVLEGKEQVMDLMAEIYREFLFVNYGG